MGVDPLSEQLRHPRDEGRDQGEGRDGAAEDHQPAAAAPPRCRGGSVDGVGIGDRPLGGVLPGDRPSGGSCSANAPSTGCGTDVEAERALRQSQDRDALRDRGGDPCGGIDDGSRLSALGGLQFGKPSLSRRIPRDVGIRSVRASPQALQLVRFLELDRPPRGIHALIVRPGTIRGKGCPAPATAPQRPSTEAEHLQTSPDRCSKQAASDRSLHSRLR